MAAKLAAMVQEVWQEKGMPSGTIDDAVTTAFRDKLWPAVEQGYGKTLADIGSAIDYDSPDAAMLKALNTNVWQFAAAKNYHQLKALSLALVDEAGNLRSFEAFKAEAFKINAEHVEQWLRAEYNNGIASGQMAGKWVEIEQQKDILPFLQYDAVIDLRTSDTCRPLDGTIRRVDDAFWQTWYPPNHWGCRSSVRQLASGPSTPKDKIVTPVNTPAMFRTNVGISGMAFPAGHPYFDGLPDEVKMAATHLQAKS